MDYTFEDYAKYYKNCKGDFGKGCYEMCGMRENGCCELSNYELIRLSLDKLGVNLPDDVFSIEELTENLFKLAEKKKVRKALVSGSFDPFTVGHLAVVKQASEIFDEVHVVIFVNSAKKRAFDIDKMLDAIRETLEIYKIKNCIVTKDNGLLSRYCQKNEIETNVRGLRNVKDYNYEEELVTVNNLYNKKLETVYFRGGGNQISSSTVRELLRYNEDVSMFVPEPVLALIREEME